MGGRGSEHCWTGWGICKQVSTTRETEVPAHCLALSGTLGGILWIENYIFGFVVFNYIHWAHFRAPGWMRRDGLEWMGLDDEF
jgi:hypothetical protein